MILAGTSQGIEALKLVQQVMDELPALLVMRYAREECALAWTACGGKKLVTVKVGTQQGRDTLAYGVGQVAAGHCVLLGFGRSPGTQEGV